MFPVCTRCYPGLTAEQVELYIRQLGGKWLEQMRGLEEVSKIEHDVAAAIATMRAEKAPEAPR
jgi:hypothetical protein